MNKTAILLVLFQIESAQSVQLEMNQKKSQAQDSEGGSSETSGKEEYMVVGQKRKRETEKGSKQEQEEVQSPVQKRMHFGYSDQQQDVLQKVVQEAKELVQDDENVIDTSARAPEAEEQKNTTEQQTPLTPTEIHNLSETQQKVLGPIRDLPWHLKEAILKYLGFSEAVTFLISELMSLLPEQKQPLVDISSTQAANKKSPLRKLSRDNKKAELYTDGLQIPGYAEEFFSALQNGKELPSPRFDGRFGATKMFCAKHRPSYYNKEVYLNIYKRDGLPDDEPCLQKVASTDKSQGQEIIEPWVYRLAHKIRYDTPAYEPLKPPLKRRDHDLLRVSKLASGHYASQVFATDTANYFDAPDAKAYDPADCYKLRARGGSWGVDKVDKEHCKNAFYFKVRDFEVREQVDPSQRVAELLQTKNIGGATLYPTVINGRLSRFSRGGYFIGKKTEQIVLSSQQESSPMFRGPPLRRGDNFAIQQ